MVLSDSTSCSYGSIDSFNYTMKRKKPNPSDIAKEIAEDHYYLLNQTYGARFADAKNSAVVSIERIIEALQDIANNDKQREVIEDWRKVLQAAREL